MKRNSKLSNFSDLPRDNPFKVPDDYFKTFPDRLNDKIDTAEKTRIRRPGIIRLVKSQLALAASLLFLVAISYFAVQFILSRQDVSNQTIQYSDIMEYGIDEYEIENLLTTYSEATINTEISETDLYNEEIIDYLIDENIDTHLIMLEL